MADITISFWIRIGYRFP